MTPTLRIDREFIDDWSAEYYYPGEDHLLGAGPDRRVVADESLSSPELRGGRVDYSEVWHRPE